MRWTKLICFFDVSARKPSRSMTFLSVDNLLSAPLITVLHFLS
ncbi:hypothetical protein [Propionivibrio sp.]|nr:hypothetical protein [Propionivibrio sp.]